MRKTKDDFKSKILEYLEKPYTIEMRKDPDGGYVIWVKELPGCISYGETPEEAFDMIRDAMKIWIATALERGKEIPEPHTQKKYSGKFLVRLPVSLHEKLVEMADDEGVSLNTLVVTLLTKAVTEQKLTFIERRVDSIEKSFLWKFEPVRRRKEFSQHIKLEDEKSKIARSA